MAIGDELIRNPGLVPASFTPEMRAAGVRLLPGVPTTPARSAPIRPFTGELGPFGPGEAVPNMGEEIRRQRMEQGLTIFGGPGQPATFGDLQRQQRMESDRMRAPSAQSLFSPDDFRSPNPFNPNEMMRPEDDSLTPDGMLAPSEMKEVGGIFQKLGDIFTNPGVNKLLASIGMQLTPSANDPLGEFAIAQAESNAQRRFLEGLESGQSAGDLVIPGLSAEGRRQVLTDFQAQQRQTQEQARLDRQEDRLNRQVDIDAAREERLANLTEAQVAGINQSIEEGKIDAEMGRIKLDALRRANAIAASANPTQMVAAGLQAFGAQLPEGVDLTGFTPEQALDLLNIYGDIEIADRRLAAAQSVSGAPPAVKLSEAMRQTHIRTGQKQLQRLRQQLSNPTATGERGGLGDESRRTILSQMREIENRILELGGDPTEVVEEATGATGTTGQESQPVDSAILDELSRRFPGVSRSILEGLSPQEQFDMLLKAQQNG